MPETRNKLDAILAQVAEAAASGAEISGRIFGSKGVLQIGKQAKGKLAAAAK